MDTDRMKIINPVTRLPEYVVVDDNEVEDLNQDRIDRDRQKKKGIPDATNRTETA
jgi:cephalosporin hydroxylase